jgi:hypothetical protein
LQIDDERKVIEEITDRMRNIAYVPIQTWKGWNPNDLLGEWFSLGQIQDPDRGNGSCLGGIFNITCLVPLALWSISTIMKTTIEIKTAAYVMMLWKYKPLNQDDAL